MICKCILPPLLPIHHKHRYGNFFFEGEGGIYYIVLVYLSFIPELTINSSHSHRSYLIYQNSRDEKQTLNNKKMAMGVGWVGVKIAPNSVYVAWDVHDPYGLIL